MWQMGEYSVFRVHKVLLQSSFLLSNYWCRQWNPALLWSHFDEDQSVTKWTRRQVPRPGLRHRIEICAQTNRVSSSGRRRGNLRWAISRNISCPSADYRASIPRRRHKLPQGVLWGECFADKCESSWNSICTCSLNPLIFSTHKSYLSIERNCDEFKDMSCNLQRRIRRGKEWRVDLRGLNGWNIRGCSIHATGYLSRNIDLTFVVLFYLCVPVVIFCTLISL